MARPQTYDNSGEPFWMNSNTPELAAPKTSNKSESLQKCSVIFTGGLQ